MYSQLGINPLIKLGKEYLSSNYFVQLQENSEIESTFDNEEKLKNKAPSKKVNKQSTTSVSTEEVLIDNTKEENLNNKLAKDTQDKEDIEITDEIDNSRRKRRRSSASIE